MQNSGNRIKKIEFRILREREKNEERSFTNTQNAIRFMKAARQHRSTAAHYLKDDLVDFIAAIKKIRYGFHPNFWIANGMELFERLAYYGQAAIFSVFLRDHLHLSLADAGKLQSLFGGLIYSLPILGGTLADKFGFRRAFSTAFAILAAGYLLIGSTGMELFAPLYAHLPVFWALVVILIFTAFGGSFIKPSVLGTVAAASVSENKSLGYAIYYWLVNIGAAIGPALAYLVRNEFGIEFVYLISSVSCLSMFIVNALFYKNIAADSRCSGGIAWDEVEKPCCRAEECALYDVPAYFFPLLDYVLAGIYYRPVLCAGLYFP